MSQAQENRNHAAVIEQQRWLQQGAIQRSYLFDIPQSIQTIIDKDSLNPKTSSRDREQRPRDSKQRWPLVLVLHGGGGNGNRIRKTTGMSQLAVREQFFVAYPQGSGRIDGRSTWNAGSCCAFLNEQGIDDIAYINQLLDDLLIHYPVDQKRIYVAGFSNGGMMAYRIASELSHRLAAVAVVSGAMFPELTAPPAPLPVQIIHSRNDPVLSWQGGKVQLNRGTEAANANMVPIEDSFRFWLQANGCHQEPERKVFKAFLVWEGESCKSRGAVQLVELLEASHVWPGASTLSTGDNNANQPINASEMVWRFFERKRK